MQRMSGSTAVETLYDVVHDDGGTNGARDALGRITKKTEWIALGDVPTSGARPLTSREYDYGYNAEGRPWLESVAVDGNVVSSYVYDENGNRTSAELAWSHLGYDTAFDASLDDSETNYNEADQLLAVWRPRVHLERLASWSRCSTRRRRTRPSTSTTSSAISSASRCRTVARSSTTSMARDGE